MGPPEKLILVLLAFLATSSNAARYLGETCLPLVPELHCVSGGNMNCVLQQDEATFRCECSPHHNPNLAGTYCHGTYGAGCVELGGTALDCNTHRRMHCYLEPVFIGTCYCANPSSQIYHEQADTCVGRAQSLCNMNATTPFGLTCTKNAICDDKGGTEAANCKCLQGYYEDFEGRCIKNGGLHGAICTSDEACDYDVHHLQCKNQTCQCGDDYKANSVGTCVRIYGAKCSVVDPCDTPNFIDCSSPSGHPGVCACENTENQLYEEESQACRTRARKYYGGAPCVQNASRQSLEDYCECDVGHITTHEGRCRPAQFPELGDPCEENGGPQCPPDTYSECSPVGNGTECRCPADRNSNLLGEICYLRYGKLCNDNLEGRRCNTDRHLECDQLVNRCRCFNQFNTIYNEERDTCLVLTGGQCTDGDTEFDQRCVDNAHCQGAVDAGVMLALKKLKTGLVLQLLIKFL